MSISRQWKWMMALAAVVSGGQAQARSYRQGEGGVADGSKGESVIITLDGGQASHLLVDLVGAVSVNATYTIALAPAPETGQDEESYITCHRGNVVASHGHFSPLTPTGSPGFSNSVETRALTDADKAAYGLSLFAPSLNGKEGFRIRAESLVGAQHREVFTITPKSRNKLFFYINALNSDASVAVVASA